MWICSWIKIGIPRLEIILCFQCWMPLLSKSAYCKFPTYQIVKFYFCRGHQQEIRMLVLTSCILRCVTSTILLTFPKLVIHSVWLGFSSTQTLNSWMITYLDHSFIFHTTLAWMNIFRCTSKSMCPLLSVSIILKTSPVNFNSFSSKCCGKTEFAAEKLGRKGVRSCCWKIYIIFTVQNYFRTNVLTCDHRL